MKKLILLILILTSCTTTGFNKKEKSFRFYEKGNTTIHAKNDGLYFKYTF